MMLAFFVFILGAFAAAQASSMGPDVPKAIKSAMRIFKIIRTPSKIDTGSAECYNQKKFENDTVTYTS